VLRDAPLDRRLCFPGLADERARRSLFAAQDRPHASTSTSKPFFSTMRPDARTRQRCFAPCLRAPADDPSRHRV